MDQSNTASKWTQASISHTPTRTLQVPPAACIQRRCRVAFFHLRSMWPFQYRHGVPMIGEMKTALLEEDDQGMHHAYEGE